jgi:hypothetical protein
VDGLGDEVGRAANGDEIDGLELADGGDGFRPALGLADGAEQAGLGAARVMVVGSRRRRYGWLERRRRLRWLVSARLVSSKKKAKTRASW